MSDQYIKILGDDISLSSDYKDIFELKFLPDNPRVYACTHGEPDFDNRTEEEQQNIIFEKLQQEPSVKRLLPEVKRHGGLMEWILVRHDTMEVIEGNSRLAVYRLLHEKGEPGDWDLIPCYIISTLTAEQQAAYLNQIHVKGKTQWSAYEKANFSYVRYKRGWKYDRIAKLFGESVTTIRIRIKVIEMMKENGDNEQSHFSYYDVMVRGGGISKEMEREGLKPLLFTQIKQLGSEEQDNVFTAQDMRRKLPEIIKKPKALKKFINGEVDLDEGYQIAKTSDVSKKVKQAHSILEGIEKQNIESLEIGELNALKHAVRKLKQGVKRVSGLVDLDGSL